MGKLMTKQLREAQIDFYTQNILKFYLKQNRSNTMSQLKSFRDLFGETTEVTVDGRLIRRARRELKRTFELTRPINEGEV